MLLAFFSSQPCIDLQLFFRFVFSMPQPLPYDCEELWKNMARFNRKVPVRLKAHTGHGHRAANAGERNARYVHFVRCRHASTDSTFNSIFVSV